MGTRDDWNDLADRARKFDRAVSAMSKLTDAEIHILRHGDVEMLVDAAVAAGRVARS